MRKWIGRTGFTPVVAALAIALGGCDLEVLNPGSIQDKDLNSPELMGILVAGVSAEYNDIQDTYAFQGSFLADDQAGTGSYFSTQQYRQGIFDDEDSEGFWEQTHEAAWSAGEAWARLQQVLEASANSSADAARVFTLMGHAHNRLSENFCALVYDVGPSQPRRAGFDSALVAFGQAITIANAAGASADQWRISALAGIAQARLGLAALGAGTYADAAAAAQTALAAMPDLDWHDDAIYHAQANQNVVWQETHGRAEGGVWSTMAQRLYDVGADGVVGGGDDADPRVPYTVCGAWNDPDPVNPDPAAGVTSQGCSSGSGAHQGADGLTAHYRQDKYPERGSDIPRASGYEMKMIIAEERLRANDMAGFIAAINDVRVDVGLPARAAPAAAGSLDFPYAVPADDGWSILDEERYATLWLTGKRLFDLDRWDHPFLDGGFLAANVPGAAALARRTSCMPVPRNECELNPNLDGDPVCS